MNESNSSEVEYTPNWPDDVLNRTETASFLTKYLQGLYGDDEGDHIYSKSFVMCLDAEWGFGKTFLLEQWSKDLKTELNHPVIYFDAWKNDFSDDPLLAFISELEVILKEYEESIPSGKELVKNVMELAKGAIKPALKAAAKIAFKKVVGSGTDEVLEIYNASSDGVIDAYMESALENHNNRKRKIEKFSEKLNELLKELVADNKAKLPMFVFIDELDRCKPSYAIELLEGIKHIFGTAGVFFIIATNKKQLSHSIKAVYGSEFDSLTYLQRFFDQEYQLPKPNFNEFAKLLIEKKYRLNSLNIEQLDLRYNLEQTFATLADCFSLSLRAQDQVAKQLKAIELNNIISIKIHHWFLLFLMMLRIKDEDVYKRIPTVNSSGSLGKIVSSNIFNHDAHITGVYLKDNQYAVGGPVRVIEILDEYLRMESMNLLDVRKEADNEEYFQTTILIIKQCILHECPNSYNRNQHYPISISKYRKIVEQAGHIV